MLELRPRSFKMPSQPSRSGPGLRFHGVVRAGISATKADVWVNGEKDLPRDDIGSSSIRGHQHSHDESHSHDHGEHTHPQADGHPHDSPSHAHPHAHEHSHEHSRGLSDIRQIISFAAPWFSELNSRDPATRTTHSGATMKEAFVSKQIPSLSWQTSITG